MKNKLYNFSFLNLRNIILAITSFIFIFLSIFVLIMQRAGSVYMSEYTNLYIVFAFTFISILVFSITYLIYPIIIRVRRRKIGTLNSKFTLYFVLIALIPAVFLGVIGMLLINLGINDWFNNKINNVINNSVFVAESYLEEHKETIKGEVYAMYNDINNSREVIGEDIEKLNFALRTQALIRSLPETYIFNSNGEIISKAFENNPLVYIPPKNAFERSDQGELVIMSSTQVNKVYALIKLDNFNDSYLFAGRSMDANVLSALNDTISARNEYTFLEKNRNQISIIFILIYVIISLLLVLLSTFLGLKFAERIVSPISSVITASNNISKGSYDDKIIKNNDYIELNRLADSFNKMSNDIVKQKKQILISKKHETWSDIARRIAHEIKNPLTPIQLSSERLEKRISKLSIESDEIDECINTIRRQVGEIGYLVDEFSGFARLPEPELKPENIYNVIRSIIDDYKNNYKNIEFRETYFSKKFELNIDKSQFSRVLQNILINSIHSIEEKDINDGCINVETSEHEDYFQFILRDNGVGLRYGKEELLKPYFTTKKKIGGSGLGLAIVEKILFDHNAEFYIDNRKDNINGAEVIIKFEK